MEAGILISMSIFFISLSFQIWAEHQEIKELLKKILEISLDKQK